MLWVVKGNNDMQCAVKKFAESKENGLCLIDMPTGTGKTYQTRLLIEKYLRGEELNEIELVIYLTPLKKNIDDIYDELQESLKDNPELFDNNVLRIYSNYECVLEHFLDIENQIQPSLKKKESFKNLKNKIIAYKSLENADNLSRETLATNLREIRTAYEPKFRHDLEAELFKDTKSEAERRKKINHDYSWVKVLYPACLTKNRKVLFMTMDKFLFGNDPIISKPYRFLSYAKTKGALIFIDEFDATKDVILNQEIDRCTDYKIDIAKLFSGITSALKSVPTPTALFANSNDIDDPKSSRSSFEKMKKKMLEVEEQYHLNYLFKLDNVDSTERYFLFDDYQIHTIASDEKGTHIGCKNDKKLNQNIITVGQKNDDGYFYRAIYAMKGALNYFIRCCAMLSRNYMQNKNDEAEARHADLMEIEQAVSTIIDYFNLDSDLAEILSTLIVDDISLPNEARKRDVFSTDFYMNGFRYYDFNDDISHDVSTTISMCYLNNTPEKFILSLANKARVVGLSATASIRSVTGNYNLDYIQLKLGDKYYELPEQDKNRIKTYVEDNLKGDYPINVYKIAFEDISPESVAKSLFEKDKNIEKCIGILQKCVSADENNQFYEIGRIGKVLFAIREFLRNKNSQVMLVLTNKNIKFNYDDDPFSVAIVNDIIQGLSVEAGLKDKFPKTHYLFGADFEKEREAYKKEVKEGDKIILFSSYPAVGTGQNLQYDLEENSGDDELKKKKDIDSIYVELPTNIIVHTENIKEEGELNKYIYQMETLRANGEISPFSSMFNIKCSFKKYMSPALFVKFDMTTPYQCQSTNNHRVKILVQAIGRICRTKEKEHEVNIYIDNEIFGKVDFSLMKDRLMNPEFEKVVALSSLKPVHDLETIITLNKAADCNMRVESRINNILSSNKEFWNEDDMVQWNLIREVVLKYPTISRDKLNELIKQPGLESLKDFYLFERGNNKMFCYLFNPDNPSRPIKFGKDPETGWALINSKNCRLLELLSNYSVRKHFEKNGYATTFEMNEGIILPVVYQNIYKGALGEVAGRVILESNGAKLKEITDPYKFEKYDFCLDRDNDVYIDFKNWSENDREDRSQYMAKAYDKLGKINGKRAYIINMISSELNVHESDNITTISTLYKCKHDGKCYPLGWDMHKLIKRILEGK